MNQMLIPHLVGRLYGQTRRGTLNQMRRSITGRPIRTIEKIMGTAIHLVLLISFR